MATIAQNDTTPAPSTNPHAAEIARALNDKALSDALAAAHTARNAELTARYGATPALPTGAITGAENLAGLTGSMLAVAMRDAAKKIVKANPAPVVDSLLVTSTPDRRTQVVAGNALAKQLRELTDNAEALLADVSGSAATALALTPAELLAPLGALENILNVFRTDYTVQSAAVAVDALALQLVVASAIKTENPKMNVRVDGLAVADSLPLLTEVERLRKVSGDLEKAAASLTAADPSKKAIDDFVPKVKAFFVIGDAKSADGQSLFDKAALAQQWSTGSKRILFVKSVSINAVLISAKSWFSWRNTVHAVLSGVVQYAYLDPENQLLSAGVVRIGGKVAINLKELAKSDTEWSATDMTEK